MPDKDVGQGWANHNSEDFSTTRDDIQEVFTIKGKGKVAPVFLN
jgi:hypothetical protein